MGLGHYAMNVAMMLNFKMKQLGAKMNKPQALREYGVGGQILGSLIFT
jgi:hypothetical protein